MIKAVIFDLDGTLLYTIEDLCDSVNYALTSFGMPARTIEEVTAYVGHGVKDLMKKCVTPETDEDTFSACLAAFREHYQNHMEEKTRPYDGITDTLDYLKDSGIRIGVLSNKFDAATKRLCEKYFENRITLALGEREGIAKKPKPDGVLYLMREFGVLPSETLYIGDSPTDIETAKNADVRSVAVTWGYRPEETLIAADYMARTPADIITIVRNITK